MADLYDYIDDERKAFIERQHLFGAMTPAAWPETGAASARKNHRRKRHRKLLRKFRHNPLWNRTQI